MNVILLRGQVPVDRNPAEIIFDKLSDCDDIYSHIASRLGTRSEIVYWGGDRVHSYNNNCTEFYVKHIKDHLPQFDPDVIIARGGFCAEYYEFLRRYPKAFKIYYGAGVRFIPERIFRDYQLILCDSEIQLRKLQTKFPNIPSSLWIKPACDNIFYPRDVKKEYDVCFVANGTQEKIKNVKWVYKAAPKNVKILHLGTKSSYSEPKNVFRTRVIRSDMATEMSKCKVGIIPYETIDSCPRAMVEMLACGLPVLAFSKVNLWENQYRPVQLSVPERFWGQIQQMLSEYKGEETVKSVANFYTNTSNIDESVAHLRGLIDDLRKNR